MEVRLRFFASLRERLGSGGPTAVPDGASVGEIWDTLVSTDPGLHGIEVRFAVNECYVDPAHVPAEGDEVAVFPPVSGGA